MSLHNLFYCCYRRGGANNYSQHQISTPWSLDVLCLTSPLYNFAWYSSHPFIPNSVVLRARNMACKTKGTILTTPWFGASCKCSIKQICATKWGEEASEISCTGLPTPDPGLVRNVCCSRSGRVWKTCLRLMHQQSITYAGFNTGTSAFMFQCMLG